MGANKKIFGWYVTGEEWLPIQVDEEGRIVAGPPAAHHITHEDGASDEISLSGLAGISPALTTPVITTSISGTAIATGAEVTTGTDNTKIVTPKAIGDAEVNTRLKSKIITATRDLVAASGDVSYTGVGFTPTGIHSIGTVGTFALSVGFADSSKTAHNIISPAINTFEISPSLILLYILNANNYQYAIIKTYDADGFTLTWTKGGSPTGTAQLRFLCFR